jgi:hypothetical protein
LSGFRSLVLSSSAVWRSGPYYGFDGYQPLV